MFQKVFRNVVSSGGMWWIVLECLGIRENLLEWFRIFILELWHVAEFAELWWNVAQSGGMCWNILELAMILGKHVEPNNKP